MGWLPAGSKSWAGAAVLNFPDIAKIWSWGLVGVITAGRCLGDRPLVGRASSCGGYRSANDGPVGTKGGQRAFDATVWRVATSKAQQAVPMLVGDTAHRSPINSLHDEFTGL
jgi:hypothetical protein